MLARFRPDPATDTDLDDIEDPDGETAQFPDPQSGTVGYSWLDARFGGSANQSGTYCFVTHRISISAIQAGIPFSKFKLTPVLLDTSVLKDADQRDLTRSIARWIFDLRDDQHDFVDGIEVRPRFGDELGMWAVFERVADQHLDTSGRFANAEHFALHPDTPEIVEAFRIHGLRWND